MADVRNTWSERIVGRLGGGAYDYVVEREWLARPGGLALWGTDTTLLFDSIQLVGDLPNGSAVLDVPCGGGPAPGEGYGPAGALCGCGHLPDMLARARRRASALGRTTWNSPRPISSGCRSVTASLTCACASTGCIACPAAAVREMVRCLSPDGRLIGDAVVLGAGRRQDLIIAFQRAGLRPGGSRMICRTADGAGLRIDFLRHQGPRSTSPRCATDPVAQRLVSTPRPVIIGRSRNVRIPGAAAHTGAMAWTACIAVPRQP